VLLIPVASLPIILAFIFAQRYIVSGLLVGTMKE
jgi:ABC-type glycerol-3-phosphate transport system permease component